MARWWCVCAVMLWAGEASGQVREVAHSVEVRTRGEVARYVITRSFYSSGDAASVQELNVEVSVPPGGVARGLDGAGLLRVSVPPGGLVTRVYTVEVPLRRAGGRKVLWYREAEEGMAPVVMRVVPERGDRVWLDGRVAPAGAAVALARVRHPLCVEGLASCVVSERRRSWPGVARYAYVVADIRHPRPADLVVTLIDPAGEPYVVHDRAASVDLSRLSARLERRAAHGDGVWSLRIEDYGVGEGGELLGWAIVEEARGARLSWGGRARVRIPSGSAVDGALVRIEVEARL